MRYLFAVLSVLVPLGFYVQWWHPLLSERDQLEAAVTQTQEKLAGTLRLLPTLPEHRLRTETMEAELEKLAASAGWTLTEGDPEDFRRHVARVAGVPESSLPPAVRVMDRDDPEADTPPELQGTPYSLQEVTLKGSREQTAAATRKLLEWPNPTVLDSWTYADGQARVGLRCYLYFGW